MNNFLVLTDFSTKNPVSLDVKGIRAFFQDPDENSTFVVLSKNGEGIAVVETPDEVREIFNLVINALNG